MNDSDLQEAADMLDAAARTKEPIPPLTFRFSVSAEDAYEIQRRNVGRRIAQGCTVVGHKVGLTAKAVQEMLGVDEPDYGHLLSDAVHNDGAELPIDDFLQPKIELELAFVIGSDIAGPGVTLDDVIEATDYVVAALEIVDSRIADWKITLADTVADNASCGAVVLGTEHRSPTDLDLTDLDAELWHNGTLGERSTTRAVLGDPALAVAWLVNKLAEFGESVRAGQLVMPGSCTRMIDVTAGDHVVGRLAGLGSVHVRLSGRRQ